MPSQYELKFVSTVEEGSKPKKALIFAIACLKTLLLLIKGWPQVAHIHFTSRASSLRKLILAHLCRLFGKEVILHSHGAEYHLFVKSLRPSFRRWTVDTLKMANCLICLSERWRRFFVDLGVNKRHTVVLPNPIAPAPHVQKIENKSCVQFLFLGEIGIRKGAFDIVKAVSILPDRVKNNIRVLIVGNGMIQELRKAIENANLCGIIQVADWVDAETRDKLLAESDALLLPSYNEGLPMSVLEAMSFALPVITTPVGGIPEYVHDRESGLLIEPGNVRALANAIQQLACDPDLRSKLGNAAREAVKPLDVKLYCAKLGTVYDYVISKGHPPEDLA